MWGPLVSLSGEVWTLIIDPQLWTGILDMWNSHPWNLLLHRHRRGQQSSSQSAYHTCDRRQPKKKVTIKEKPDDESEVWLLSSKVKCWSTYWPDSKFLWWEIVIEMKEKADNEGDIWSDSVKEEDVSQGDNEWVKSLVLTKIDHILPGLVFSRSYHQF